MTFLPADEQLAILSWGAAEVIPSEDLRAKLALGRPLRVKLGLDPTAEHVTLGWAVVLRRLRLFQDLGHVAVLIVGDFTARVGDPSEQNKTRPMLSEEQVRRYADRVLEQFRLVLAPERLDIRYNSEWLEGLGVAGLVRLASQSTVARMLERDDFANRYAAGTPISVGEFLYPLLQGYDSVAVRSDVELGGTDQHFNLLTGRDVQRAHGQDPQAIMTMPLLEGTDGVRKMSQSLGNYVGITEPPDEMFGKLMSIPDELMPKYFRLTSDLPPEDVESIERGLASGDMRPEETKRRLGWELVRLYHGQRAADEARERFDRVFREHRLPDDIAEIPIPTESMDGTRIYMPRLLALLGLAESSSDGRRLIAQAGVKLGGETLTEEVVQRIRLQGKVLQVGRRRFVRLS